MFHHRSNMSRRAFTLIEVMLVMVLLVVVATITVPYMFGTFTRSKLRNGGDVLKAALTQARLSAMETGQVFVFRCEAKGRRFQAGSLPDMLVAAQKGEQTLAAASEDDGTITTRLDTDQLPGGVTFVSGQAAPSAQLIAFTGGSDDIAWLNPIVFLPDGTATDATLLIANENEQTLRVTLRGLTGAVRIGEIGAEAMPK